MNLQTIQKFANDKGIDESYVRTMIKNNNLKAYKQDGYNRIYVDVDEFNSSIRPINNAEQDYNLEKFLI
jgi:hypothetical protein